MSQALRLGHAKKSKLAALPRIPPPWLSSHARTQLPRPECSLARSPAAPRTEAPSSGSTASKRAERSLGCVSSQRRNCRHRMRAGEGSACAASAPGGAGGGRRRGTGLGEAAGGGAPTGIITRGGGVASGRRPLPEAGRSGAAAALVAGLGLVPAARSGRSRGESPMYDEERRPPFSAAPPLGGTPAGAIT